MPLNSHARRTVPAQRTVHKLTAVLPGFLQLRFRVLQLRQLCRQGRGLLAPAGAERAHHRGDMGQGAATEVLADLLLNIPVPDQIAYITPTGIVFIGNIRV